MAGLGAATNYQRDKEEDDDEEDYMGDLSHFLPPEQSNPPKLCKKVANEEPSSILPSKKKSKKLSWQELRKLERERKQQQEDELTKASIENPIPQNNIGFKMLKQMGYTPGSALGKDGCGIAEPVGVDIRRSRAGIGREDPHKEKRKREEMEAWIDRKKQEASMEDFGLRQKSQWRSRRIVVNFHKAKAALDQLENKEIELPKKSEDGEVDEEEDEEEEEITEEDLQDILTKLREEHRYCLFCGFQYDTPESLLSNCPGPDEDDH